MEKIKTYSHLNKLKKYTLMMRRNEHARANLPLATLAYHASGGGSSLKQGCRLIAYHYAQKGGWYKKKADVITIKKKDNIPISAIPRSTLGMTKRQGN
jgi:hypothetical protein